MLAEALKDVDQGAWDHEVVDWLGRKDAQTVATVASLLRRAFEAGLSAGRAERAEELPAKRWGQGPDIESRLLEVMDLLRQDAEQRAGVDAGDMAVVEDPVYGAFLDAWNAWAATRDAAGGDR